MIPRGAHHSVQAVVSVTLHGQTEPASLGDISERGCQVVTSTHVRPGDYVAMDILFARAGTPLRVTLAVVRWVHPPSVGIEFLVFRHGSHYLLRELVQTSQAT